MSRYPVPMKKQAGMMLLEGLIAILIFSLGILAIVGMQAVATKQVTDSKYRSEANLLVNELIGTMWVSDRTVATLQAQFNSPSGATYATWSARVAATLPGVVAGTPTAPSVVVSGAGDVTISVFWVAPNDQSATTHNYTAIASIR